MIRHIVQRWLSAPLPLAKAKNSAWQNSGLVRLPKDLFGKVWFYNSALLVEWIF
jgi:hypothetical protein